MVCAGQELLPDRYTVVPRTLCFVFSAGQVLLLRGAPDKRLWPNLLNGVGGHVEADEDVYAAARREIAEETGVAISGLRLAGIVNVPVTPPNAGVMLFVFAATATSRDVRPCAEGTPEWVPCDRLPADEMVGDLPVLLPRVLATGPLASPFFALYHYDEQGRLQVVFADE